MGVGVCKIINLVKIASTSGGALLDMLPKSGGGVAWDSGEAPADIGKLILGTPTRTANEVMLGT